MSTTLLRPHPPSREVLEIFLERQSHLLQLERDAEEEQTRLLNSNCSPRLLEQRGLALGGLGVSSISIGLGGKTLVEVHRPLAYHTDQKLPPHTFRHGDPVRLETHVSGPAGGKGGKKKETGTDAGAVEGVVYKVNAERVTVAVDEGKDVDLPERIRLLKLANSITFVRMERTLERLTKTVLPDPTKAVSEPANIPLINSLLGIQPPSWRNDVPPTLFDPEGESGIQWYSEALNDSQKEAIKFCLTADQVACVHGPPGTGKTHTLVELVFQLLSRPASPSTTLPPRILITTPSNLALDNILLRLYQLSRQPPYSTLLPEGSILRLGHPTRVHRDLVRETLDYRASNGDESSLVRDVADEIEGHMSDLSKKKGDKGAIKGKDRNKRWEEIRMLRKEFRQREAKVVNNVVSRAQVVLATCHSAGSKQLNNTMFDVAIVDEATQALEAVCWVPVLRAKRLVLAGDPQQLPPTIMSKADKHAKTAKPKSGPQPSVATDAATKEDASAGTPPVGPDADGEDDNDDGTLPPTDEIKALSLSDAAKRTELRPPRTLETTLFDRLERLYGAGVKRVLQVQYRMNKHIASFPSKVLYNSELVSAPSVADRTLLELPTIVDATSEDAKDTLTPTVVFFDTSGCEFFERTEAEDEGSSSSRGALGEGSKSNANEAEVAARWARKLVGLGVPPAEIGIVTPYQAQVALLSEMLKGEYEDMTIGTVDGLQGQEREAVIVSLVRSNPTGEVGFLGEYRRLNVAMTRAKRQLCVVGDSATVGKGSKYLKSWMDWLEAEADVRWAGEEVV